MQHEHFAVAAFDHQKTGQLQFRADGSGCQQIGLIAQSKYGYFAIRLSRLSGFYLFRLVFKTPFGDRNACRGIAQRFFLRQPPDDLQLIQNPVRNNDLSDRRYNGV